MRYQETLKPNTVSQWIKRWRGLVALAALSVLTACGGGGGATAASTAISEPLSIDATVQAGVVYVPPEKTAAWVVTSTVSDVADSAATSFEVPLTEDVTIGGIYLVNDVAYKITSIQVTSNGKYIFVSQPELKEIFKSFKITGDLPLSGFEDVTSAQQTGLLHQIGAIDVTAISQIRNFKPKNIDSKNYEPSPWLERGCFKIESHSQEFFDNGTTIKPMGFKFGLNCEFDSLKKTKNPEISLTGGVYPSIKFGGYFDLVDVNTYDENVNFSVYTNVAGSLTTQQKFELHEVIRLLSIQSKITAWVPIGTVPVPVIINIWIPLDFVFMGEVSVVGTMGYSFNGKASFTKRDGIKLVNLAEPFSPTPKTDVTVVGSFAPLIRPGFGLGIYGMIPVSLHPKIGVKVEQAVNLQAQCSKFSVQGVAGLDLVSLPNAWGDRYVRGNELKRTKELITLMDLGQPLFEKKLGVGCDDPVANITMLDSFSTTPIYRNLNGADLKLSPINGSQKLLGITSKFATSYEWRLVGKFGLGKVVGTQQSYTIDIDEVNAVVGGAKGIQLKVGNGLLGANKTVSQQVNFVPNEKPVASGGIIRSGSDYILSSTSIDLDGNIVAVEWLDMSDTVLWTRTSNTPLSIPVNLMQQKLGINNGMFVMLKIRVRDNEGAWSDSFSVVETLQAAPVVSSITPTTATVGTPTTFTVTGNALTSGMGFAVADCNPSSNELAGGTATQRQFACTPQVAGSKAGVVKTVPGGTALSNFSVNVSTRTTTSSLLTDTGITAAQCYQAGSDTMVSCNSAAAIALNASQDGMIGRDVTTPDPADGKRGFSYSAVPNPAGGSFQRTECVKDNITGLTWEGKTATGARAGSATFTNLGDSSSGEASAYVSAVNALELCGYTDWRLPTADELQSLVDYGVASPGPTLDTTWFPNTPASSSYWSASPSTGGVGGWYVGFTGGNIYTEWRGYGNQVRLVR